MKAAEHRSEFFNELFDKFNKINFQYCILNGYKNYPEEINSDIDIAVISIIDFEKILQKLKKSCGISIIQKLQHQHKAINYFLSKNVNGDLIILSIDVYQSYVFKNRIIFDSKFLLKDRIVYKNFYIINPINEFEYYFIKKIIKGDGEENIINLRRLHKRFKKELTKSNPLAKSTSFLYEYIEESNLDSLLNGKNNLLHKYLKFSNYSLKLVFYEIVRKIKRVFEPTGIMVSFLGPDGTGKTTLINKIICEHLLPFRKVKIFHLKPRVIGQKAEGTPVINPHEQKKYRPFLSYIKLFHFQFDYLIGLFTKIIPYKIISSIIIFDRYYEDIYIDPVRIRYGGNLHIAKVMRKIIPNPDIQFVLTANPNIIFSRKKELPKSKIKQLVLKYRSLPNDKYIQIDTGSDIEQIKIRVLNEIYKKMSNRY